MILVRPTDCPRCGGPARIVDRSRLECTQCAAETSRINAANDTEIIMSSEQDEQLTNALAALDLAHRKLGALAAAGLYPIAGVEAVGKAIALGTGEASAPETASPAPATRPVTLTQAESAILTKCLARAVLVGEEAALGRALARRGLLLAGGPPNIMSVSFTTTDRGRALLDGGPRVG